MCVCVCKRYKMMKNCFQIWSHSIPNAGHTHWRMLAKYCKLMLLRIVFISVCNVSMAVHDYLFGQIGNCESYAPKWVANNNLIYPSESLVWTRL